MHLCAQRLVAELIAIANGSQQLGSCSLTTPIADRSPFPMLWLGKRWIDVVTASYVEKHIKIGIEALKLVRRRGRSVKHLRFEDDFDAGREA